MKLQSQEYLRVFDYMKQQEDELYEPTKEYNINQLCNSNSGFYIKNKSVTECIKML